MSVNLVKLGIKKHVFQRTGYDKYCKIKLFSGAISHGASNKP